MFRKVLVANRGEIALRILRACRELGIETVQVYSEADKDSLPVRYADESICIGPPAASESYLNIPRIISAAELTNVDGIHPGYGFLAENAHFAEVCESCDIRFIGPRPDAIRLMGDKAKAREAMREAGLPLVPGSPGPVETEEEAVRVAGEIGFPVILKAAAGGGGKGMRVARDPDGVRKAYHVACAEAQAAFGNPQVYVERLVEEPRHVEIQVIGDGTGHLVHLGERDCTIQRRHQKLVEEGPSPALTPALRNKMGELALRGARSVGYESAGTMEFLLSKDGEPFFIEMNTRIQVEHPVTEWLTGRDVVKDMIRVAAGEELGYAQDDVSWQGHAIEVRLNAEDPRHGFRPSPGLVQVFHLPGGPGVRVDTHVHPGYRVPPHYDSLLAKVIVHARNRDEAIDRLARGLDETVIEGVATTLPLHQRVVADERFRNARFHTGTFEDLPAELAKETPPAPVPAEVGRAAS